MNISKRFISKLINIRCCRRYSEKTAAVEKKHEKKENPSIIRNIGILAHIDAGKTTTTERMLFYSGTIGNMGEVHNGNTVTDFMDQERERGITITAASVTFPWENHKINLLDTPGHIDFTMEVEQTLNVMDGAIIVLDASAGVEAQTITVWRQADRYKIPRIIYLNKMDKPDAGFFQSVQSIQTKLQSKPILIQLPILDKSRTFRGIVDLLSMEKLIWDVGKLGAKYSHSPLTEEDGKAYDDALLARSRLTDTLTDFDDRLAEFVITENVPLEQVPASKLKESIKKVTLGMKGVAVLCGSSYKNMGVQPLMNAVIDYLPSPINSVSSKSLSCFGDSLCARAFKVRHDLQGKAVTFFRVYSGSLAKGQKIYNMRSQRTEECGKVMIAYADDYEVVEDIGPGNIAAVTGLKETTSGDLVTSSASIAEAARKKMEKESVELNTGAYVPDPVFFCSIEAPSPAFEAPLEKALSELEREDPSLRVSVNEETGQTILGGMGELHLDVIKKRIQTEYKIDAYLGPLQISYKEMPAKEAKDTFTVEHRIGSSRHAVKLIMSVFPSGETKKKSDELLLLDRSHNSADNIAKIFPKHLLAVKQGVESALTCGPKAFCPVTNIQIMLHWLEVGRGTSETIITSATSQCVKKLISQAETRLLEPIMLLEIISAPDFMDAISSNLCGKRAQILNTGLRGTDRTLVAEAPLSELLGYSSLLRKLSSGNASFTMEFLCFREMDAVQEAKAIKSITGFDPVN